MSLSHLCIAAGALLGASGVVLGALGAHALEARLSAAGLDSWDTAVLYQLVHAVALLGLGVWAASGPSRMLTWAAWAFATGVLCFSGSLYLLVLTDVRWLGPVTPVGGVLLVFGWALLFWAAATKGEST